MLQPLFSVCILLGLSASSHAMESWVFRGTIDSTNTEFGNPGPLPVMVGDNVEFTIPVDVLTQMPGGYQAYDVFGPFDFSAGSNIYQAQAYQISKIGDEVQFSYFGGPGSPEVTLGSLEVIRPTNEFPLGIDLQLPDDSSGNLLFESGLGLEDTIIGAAYASFTIDTFEVVGGASPDEGVADNDGDVGTGGSNPVPEPTSISVWLTLLLFGAGRAWFVSIRI